MALKGGRLIVIQGISFRWVFKGDYTPKAKSGSPYLAHVAVREDSNVAGCKGMVAFLESTRWEGEEAHGPENPHKAFFSPRDARTLIEHAMENGWVPCTKGAQYVSPPGVELRTYRTRIK